MKHAANVDTSADHLIPDADITRERFSRERSCIQLRRTRDHHAVDRDPVSCFDHDMISDLQFIGIDGDDHSFALDICMVRADVHQLSDRSAGFLHCITLKQFPDLIKKHHCYCLRILSKEKCPDRRDRHQKMFIKNIAVKNIFTGTQKYIPADHKINGKKQHKLGILRVGFGKDPAC